MVSMRDATRKKRQLVVDTALRLFAEKGFENVSVDEIIAAAGISKGTFYHYFKNKDEMVLDLGRSQKAIIDRWNAKSPTRIRSLEGHINRLFLDLSSNIEDHPKLVRSLFMLAAQNERMRKGHNEQFRHLYQCLIRWLPDPEKVELLLSTYQGALLVWALGGKADLPSFMRDQLAGLWNGLRFSGPESGFVVDAGDEAKLRVAVIGGGLAGLTAAAYLAESPFVEGVLFERSPQLGGRAFTYEKSGFTLNYGAHAIYGIDRHTIGKLERELGLSFSSKPVDKRKVMYEKYSRIAEAPLDFVNLVRTELLNAAQKMRFAGEISAIIAHIHTLKNYRTLGDYLAESDAHEDVKELWEHLVCSNFFIAPEDARNVPGPVISEYYQNLFRSHRPVNYILGSWAVITNQLRQKIEAGGRWEIAQKQGIESIRYEEGKYVLQTKLREASFDRVVFAMPVQQVAKMLRGTAWEPFLKPYENNTPTEVMVYDVGLAKVVARPFSYISDMNHKLFISDVSATDNTLVPEGGQLLQGIAYIRDEGLAGEDERKAYLDERMRQMEQLFDKHYPGWREAAVVHRVSKKAMVQSVKHIAGNRMLPIRIENVPFYFCGDGCEGKGELAERAFSSARNAARALLREVEAMRAMP